MYPSTTAAVNSTFFLILGIIVVLLVLILATMIFFVVRFRRGRKHEVKDIGGNWKLETVWIVASTVLVMAIFFVGLDSFKFLRKIPQGAMKIGVTGMQWSWEFTYENGRKTGSLVVPQGRDIALDMKTPDVIHGFFVPAYRIKQDIVPGMTNHVWFAAKDLGTYDILCTQYCGEEHSKMISSIFVVPPDVYAKWYAGEQVDIPGLPAEDASPS
ncbi:MAG TPA: cytochrome c oxidase subunit II [Spirochaetia bacterium]